MGFTFHHVSIKTIQTIKVETDEEKFTFHHVSIKTIKAIVAVWEAFNIHIPPCIY